MGDKFKIDEQIISRHNSLIKMVEYQDASIISRTLVNKNTGSITLFAFDKGQELSEHTTPYDALVQVVDGKGEIIIDGNTNMLEAGSIILMPAAIPHAVKAPERFKMLLTMIKS